MSVKDNFSNPKGIVGRLMLTGMNIGHTPMAKWSLNQIDFPADAKVLDIGCGGGINIKRMLKLCPEGKVYGLDISDESVRKSKKVNRKDLGTRCRIRKGSAEKIPVKDGTFSIVTAFETIYFWNNISDCFAEVRRVLAPEGKFFVCCDSGDPDLHWDEKIPNMTVYSPEEVKEIMLKAGFNDAAIRQDDRCFCVCGYVSGDPSGE